MNLFTYLDRNSNGVWWAIFIVLLGTLMTGVGYLVSRDLAAKRQDIIRCIEAGGEPDECGKAMK